MLRQRIMTALGLGPLFFAAIILLPVWAVEALCLCLSLLILYEYWGIVHSGTGSGGSLISVKLMAYLMFGAAPSILHWMLDGNLPYSGWLFIYLVFSLLMVMVTYDSLKAPFNSLSIYLFGFLYVSMFLFPAFGILDLAQGRVLIAYLLVVVFSGDIFAYSVGKVFGRHRLCPEISPKKTVEGALGGLSASLVFGGLYAHLFIKGFGAPTAILLAGGLGAFAQLGDLMESMLKRTYGVKDSGWFLPGHGGFLDRFDGVIFALPVFYTVLQVLQNG